MCQKKSLATSSALLNECSFICTESASYFGWRFKWSWKGEGSRWTSKCGLKKSRNSVSVVSVNQKFKTSSKFSCPNYHLKLLKLTLEYHCFRLWAILIISTSSELFVQNKKTILSQSWRNWTPYKDLNCNNCSLLTGREAPWASWYADQLRWHFVCGQVWRHSFARSPGRFWFTQVRCTL